MARADRALKDGALERIAAGLEGAISELLEANADDVVEAQTQGLTGALIDRLTLTEDRVRAMAQGVREIVALPDPVGEVIEERTLRTGLELRQVRFALGVVAVVYEARPNVKVTPALFARYPTPEDLAGRPGEVEELIQSTGFYRNKAKSIIGMANALVDRFGGEVPAKLSDLVTLPGVGRKTGNVVRSVAMGLPGLPVDTHVLRLSGRLGLTTETDPVKVELELNPMVPASERGAFSLRLILHGRRVCKARKPRCGSCLLADFCPSAGRI